MVDADDDWQILEDETEDSCILKPLIVISVRNCGGRLRCKVSELQCEGSRRKSLRPDKENTDALAGVDKKPDHGVGQRGFETGSLPSIQLQHYPPP